jgi:hypothetical protein
MIYIILPCQSRQLQVHEQRLFRYLHVHLYIHIYIYIHTYTYIHTQPSTGNESKTYTLIECYGTKFRYTPDCLYDHLEKEKMMQKAAIFIVTI